VGERGEAGREVTLLSGWWSGTTPAGLTTVIVDALHGIGASTSREPSGGAVVTLDARAVRQLRRHGLVVRNAHRIAANRATIPETAVRVNEVRAYVRSARSALDVHARRDVA
jgi:hypothetical protein